MPGSLSWGLLNLAGWALGVVSMLACWGCLLVSLSQVRECDRALQAYRAPPRGGSGEALGIGIAVGSGEPGRAESVRRVGVSVLLVKCCWEVLWVVEIC